jgi:hypothetical protein
VIWGVSVRIFTGEPEGLKDAEVDFVCRSILIAKLEQVAPASVALAFANRFHE